MSLIANSMTHNIYELECKIKLCRLNKLGFVSLQEHCYFSRKDCMNVNYH